MHHKQPADRTWIWVTAAVAVLAVLSAGLVTRRAPRNSVPLAAIEEVESQLRSEGFILTNSMQMHSESIVLGIPVSRILGTSDHSANLPYKRADHTLTITYRIKARHAFGVGITADATNTPRAAKIAADLKALVPALQVTVRTNAGN